METLDQVIRRKEKQGLFAMYVHQDQKTNSAAVGQEIVKRMTNWWVARLHLKFFGEMKYKYEIYKRISFCNFNKLNKPNN